MAQLKCNTLNTQEMPKKTTEIAYKLYSRFTTMKNSAIQKSNGKGARNKAFAIVFLGSVQKTVSFP